MSNKTPTTRTPGFRFSLRALLLLLATVAACLAGWTRSATLQRDAIEAAKKINGTIVFEHEHKQRSAGKNNIVEPWLSNFLPDEYVFEVKQVWVSAHIPDERLEEVEAKLKRLPNEPKLVRYFAR